MGAKYQLISLLLTCITIHIDILHALDTMTFVEFVLHSCNRLQVSASWTLCPVPTLLFTLGSASFSNLTIIKLCFGGAELSIS